MVKALSQDENKRIADAIAEAEKKTTAEIAVVVLPASDLYPGHMLLFGFGLATLIGITVMSFGYQIDLAKMIALQLALMATFLLLPPLRHLVIKLIHRRTRQHHAAKRAIVEFYRESARVPAYAPVVLLFVSLAENYVHVLHSRSLKDKIPQSFWDSAINNFTSSVRNGLAKAVIQVIDGMVDVLIEEHPENLN